MIGRVGGIFWGCCETVPSKEKRKEERKERKKKGGREKEIDFFFFFHFGMKEKSLHGLKLSDCEALVLPTDSPQTFGEILPFGPKSEKLGESPISL